MAGISTRIGRRYAVGAALLGAMTLVAARAAPEGAEMAEKARNRAAAVALLEMSFNEKKVSEAFERYVGPVYIQHNPRVPDGREAAIRLLSEGVKRADIRYSVKRTAADGDLVFVHSNVRVGDDPRGNAVVDIFRFEKGKVVEHWDVAQPVPAEAANANTMF